MNRVAKPTKAAKKSQKTQKRAIATKKVAKAPVKTTKSRKIATKVTQSAPQTLNKITPVKPAFTFSPRKFSTIPGSVEIEANTVVPTRRPTILNHSLVLMCSGPDDKDVLPLVAQTISKLNGSMEESRMTCLGADFSITSLLTIPMTVKPDHLEKELMAALPDFTVACRMTSPAPASSSYEPAKILALDVEGPDQPKIVTTFAQTLYKHNVSIKDVITDTSSAPFLGYNVFAMKAVVSIPLKTDMKQLEADLQTFETQFGLNLSVSDPAEQQAQMQEQQQQQQM